MDGWMKGQLSGSSQSRPSTRPLRQQTRRKMKPNRCSPRSASAALLVWSLGVIDNKDPIQSVQWKTFNIGLILSFPPHLFRLPFICTLQATSIDV
ncbi:hypothetical protein L249_0831 [Ophiocordyceps polyrhachis-furcata BCC 54312]|uniref:Uncharacterized protein n=1 Tax=Ophiocordyceps polyrhachis-furcata BCC 54312 TaxID=1330021 RepID=A0A367LDQ1_9HYPO|nr:hypothetical protein L249_0831 [Ophiocordyceps polyrhachis-furcata BCC 54312]